MRRLALPFTLGASEDMGDRPRLRTPLVLVLAFIALVMQVFDPSPASRMLLVCLVGLLILSFVWTRSLARGLSFSRSRRYGWAQVGDRVEESFELGNASRVPLLWVEIEDESTLPGYTARRVESAGGGSVKRWLLDMVCTRRGVYRLGPMRLRFGDPFGLFEAVKDFPNSETFVVYPPVSRLPRLDLPRGAAAGTASVRRRSLEWTTNASSVRHYVPGDELRTVHWPISAKYDTLYVKEFDLEPSGNVWIVLDLDEGVQLGSGAESTEEYAVIFAASLFNAMLAEGRAVGLAFSGATPDFILPSRGSEHLWRVLRALAVARTAPGLPLADFLTSTASSLGRGLTTVIITPSLSEDWLARVAALQRQGLAVHVVLVDPLSFGDGVDGGDGPVTALAHRLADLGITVTRIQKGYHFTPIVRGKRQGQTEFVVGATGRLIARPVEE